LRIISGKAKGTKLETLEGLDTRPTLDRVKEALFSIIQNEIWESKVLDLFSGSGALGLESLSRGAKIAYLCDISKKAIEIIKQNIKKTHFEEQTKIINKNYKKCLEEVKNEQFDLIFLDPPYRTNYGIDAVRYITENNMITKDGTMIFETDQKEEEYLNELEEYASIKGLRKYGRVTLVILGLRKEWKSWKSSHY